MLLDLPNEILCLIAESLDGQGDRYHLAVSCQRLYPLIRPTLFSHISLCGVKAISSLLYAIVREEKFASAVRYLELISWDVPDCPHPNNEPFEYDAELMHRLVGEVQCPEERKDPWEKHLESGVDDAWLGLLIPRLNGLRKIVLNWPHSAEWVPDMLVRAASENTSPFPRLEEAYSSWWDTEYGVEASLSLPFFKLPSMRKIGGYMVVDDPDDPRPLTHSSPITEIDLDQSASIDGMRTWIESCQALKHYRICYGGATVSDEDMNTPAIRQSLELHKTTLESVWICPNSEMLGRRPWIGSWSEFTSLKCLHVAFPDLFGVDDDAAMPFRRLGDILPPSLEKLYICECKGHYLSWAPKKLEELIDQRVLPHLKHLTLEGYPGGVIYKPETQQPFHQLKQRCDEAGIIFNAYSEENQERAALDFNWPFMEGHTCWD